MSATASSEPPSSGYQHHTQTQSPPQDRSQYPRETSPRLAVSYKTSPVSDSVATSQSINSLSPSNHDTLSSKLSPTAPQFHAMQRDSPIDIHSLPLPQESNLLPTSTRPPETTLRTPALSALSSSVSNGALDFSANAAISSQRTYFIHLFPVAPID